MDKQRAAFLTILMALAFCFTAIAEANNMEKDQALNARQQAIVPIAALAAMPGTEGQLFFHLGAAMNIGLTETQLRDFIRVLDVKVGKNAADRARRVLNAVLDDK